MSDPTDPLLFAPSLPQLDKPLFVFLPGLDGTGKLLAPQVEFLSPHFDLRCLTIPENNRQDWQTLAQRVIDRVSDVQRQRPVYLCGESFGGCLALQVAMMAPSLIHRLVLINPASALGRSPWLRWATHAAESLPDWLFAVSGALALPLLAHFDRIPVAEQQRFISTVRPISQACVTWRLRMLRQFALRPQQLRRLTMPVALLSSGRDRLFSSVEEARRLQSELPRSVTYALPDSGHVCLIEQNVNLADCLKAIHFLPKTGTLSQWDEPKNRPKVTL